MLNRSMLTAWKTLGPTCPIFFFQLKWGSVLVSLLVSSIYFSFMYFPVTTISMVYLLCTFPSIVCLIVELTEQQCVTVEVNFHPFLHYFKVHNSSLTKSTMVEAVLRTPLKCSNVISAYFSDCAERNSQTLVRAYNSSAWVSTESWEAISFSEAEGVPI